MIGYSDAGRARAMAGARDVAPACSTAEPCCLAMGAAGNLAGRGGDRG